MSNKRDFATGTVLTAPSPATTGTSLVLQSGEGARFPETPFYITAHPADDAPTLDNAEKLLVTNVSTDTLTITRAQGATTAKSIAVDWRISNAIFTEDFGSTGIEVAQTAHGFSVGDVLRSSGTDGEYTEAQADSAANAETVGIVSAVLDVDNFTLTTGGLISDSAVVPTETAGTVLFLSEATAGLLTTTEPTGDGEISKPVAVVTASNSEMQVLQMRGMEVNTGGAYPDNPYCFRAYNSSSTTLTDATVVQVAFATEVYDYNNDFASNAYTAPYDGVYHFDFKFEIDGSLVSPVTTMPLIYVDGVEKTRGNRYSPDSSNSSTSFSGDILLTAGEVVTFRAYQDSGGNESTETGDSFTYVSGHLIHRT